MTYPVATLQPTVPWAALSPYVVGATVTPLNENDPTVTLPQYQFVAIFASGTSGASAPAWTVKAGTTVADGGITWFNTGIYPN